MVKWIVGIPHTLKNELIYVFGATISPKTKVLPFFKIHRSSFTTHQKSRNTHTQMPTVLRLPTISLPFSINPLILLRKAWERIVPGSSSKPKLNPHVYANVTKIHDKRLPSGAIMRQLVVSTNGAAGGIPLHYHHKTKEVFKVVSCSRIRETHLLALENDQVQRKPIHIGQTFEAAPGRWHGFALPPHTKLELLIEVTNFCTTDIVIHSV